MNISLQSYRIRIGTYVSRISRPAFHRSFRKIEKKENIRITVFFLMLLFGKLFYIEEGRILNVQILRNKQYFLPASMILENHHSVWSCGLNWPYSACNVNLEHYVYGNKRNLGYRYFSWNCDRGFISKGKIEDVRIFSEKHKPHFMAISEVDLRRNENNKNEENYNELSTIQVHEKFRIDGYRIILPNSWDLQGKARIMVYASDEVKASIKKPNDDENYIQNISLDVGFGRSKTHVVCFFYREWKSCVTNENSRESQYTYLSKLVDIWRRSTSTDREFIALGDMNLCASKMNDNSYTCSYLSDIVNNFNIEESCHQLIDNYTRIRNVNGEIKRSCLDHIYTNCLSKMNKPTLHGVGQSDHLGIMVTKYSKELRTTTRTTKKRVYKNFDEEAFVKDIKQAKAEGLFNDMFNTEDVEKAGDIFTEVFKAILDKHAPIMVIQNRKSYVPYISKELKAEMKSRDELKVRAAKSGTIADYDLYKRKRNEVLMTLKTAKEDYFKQKFSDVDQTPGDVWKTAFRVLGKNKSEFPSQILIGQELCSSPNTIAEKMNQYFIEKISIIKRNSPTTPQAPLTELQAFLKDKLVTGERFAFSEVDDTEVIKLIKTMKGKKSCGIDWICGYSLKLAAKDLVSEIACLINISIKSGQFYSKWKYSKILPGYKNKGSAYDARFYRPISNLSELSKLAEKVVHQQVYQYLHGHSLIHPDHHGFLPNHSTATALQQLVDTWLRAADGGKLSATIFLDLRAGFDVINHEILIQKLKEYNFADTAISWFHSYLIGRHQCVQIESSFSSYLSVPWGIPQGSILGPLLFLIYVNELPEVVKLPNIISDEPAAMEGHDEDTHEEETSVIVFADDNSTTTSHDDPEILEQKIQTEGDRVTEWFKRNEITCSGEKTKLLVMGTKTNRQIKIENKNFRPVVNLSGETIGESTSEKVLGVVVNNIINWSNHLYGDTENEGLIAGLSKRVGMLKNLKKYMTNEKLSKIIEGIFTSKLIYGMNVWGGLWDIPGTIDNTIRTSITKNDLKRLQVLQNKTMRMETDMDYKTPTAELLRRTRKLSVHQMIAYSTAVQVFNISRNYEPKYHYERLFRPTQDIETRSLHINRVNYRLSLGRASFFHQGTRLWTALPGNLKECRTVGCFKRLCKAWVKENIKIKP